MATALFWWCVGPYLPSGITDYRATVYRCSAQTVAATVQRLLVTDATVIRPDGVPSDWTYGTRSITDNPPIAIDDLDDIDAVVTTCALAISDTGTVILDHGPGQGRRSLTLIPDHHIVIVEAEQVVASVPDAIHRLRPGSVQTWISGPSATSDIELNRVEGVHGPRRLEVILVDRNED